MDWQIPVKRVVGAVFTVSTVLMLLVGLPHARVFALVSVPLGVIIGVVLYLWHKRRPVQYTDIDPRTIPGC